MSNDFAERISKALQIHFNVDNDQNDKKGKMTEFGWYIPNHFLLLTIFDQLKSTIFSQTIEFAQFGNSFLTDRDDRTNKPI